LQTLGAETVCEVELDRSTLNLTVDSLLQQDPAASDHPLLPDLPDKQQEDDGWFVVRLLLVAGQLVSGMLSIHFLHQFFFIFYFLITRTDITLTGLNSVQ